MSNAVTISGSKYTVRGVVKDQNQEGVLDLHVLVYDKDIHYDDYLGITVTSADGSFSLSFDTSQFRELKIFDRDPDLYFIVKYGGHELLNTADNPIKNATEATPAIELVVDLSSDKARSMIKKEAVPGWVGGFLQTNEAFKYPEPDLSSLGKPKDNMANIDKLQRQQKVLWPEFSWLSKPGEKDEKRCYQMFAPDISRLGYTDDGRVYSIICPQIGTYIPKLGTMNVEVTVTGNRGWVDEDSRTLAADIGVEGKIWFSKSSLKGNLLRLLVDLYEKEKLGDEYDYFPSSKEKAIVIKTFKPGCPNEPFFPVKKGLCDDFPIPDYAKHQDISWSAGNLAVEIGAVVPTGHEKIDKLNQIIVDLFNVSTGNMLKKGSILTWNVWFNAPELVNEDEWRTHAEEWRESIDVDHASPDGPSTIPRYYNGEPFEPIKDLAIKGILLLIKFLSVTYFSKDKSSKAHKALTAIQGEVEEEAAKEKHSK